MPVINRALLGILVAAGLLGCAGGRGAAPSPIDALTLPYYAWMAPYFDNPGEKRYLDIDALMARHDLDRLQAHELQNVYRDTLEGTFAARGCANGPPTGNWDQRNANPCFSSQERRRAFDGALAQVRAGELESGWSSQKAKDARLIVVFDLDETLISHDRAAGTITLAPGYADAIARSRALGAAVVFFTAKPDQSLAKVLAMWTLNGEPITRHVDAIFSLNHLTVKPRTSSAAAALTGSKDLRMIDPTLQKVVLVDDNPTRVLQHDLLRRIPRFERPRGDARSADRQSLDGGGFLGLVMDEIEEAAAWARANRRPFSAAIRPYSYRYRGLVTDLASLLFDGDRGRAIEALRRDPSLARLAR